MIPAASIATVYLIAARRRLRHTDSEASLAQDDLVAVAEAHAERAIRHSDRSSVADHARAMRAAVVVKPVRTGARVVRDVGVPARDALVDVTAVLEEGDVVRANQPVAAIADLDGATEIDPLGGQRIFLLLSGADEHGELDRWRRHRGGVRAAGGVAGVRRARLRDQRGGGR